MRYLFVGGPARSGTTAFVQLINRHPDVALGIERYKFLYNKDPKNLGPHLFESERFFCFDSRETNVRSDKLGDLDDFKKKFELAEYRGDKMPHVMRYHRILNRRFPQCRFIIMYRDIHRICSSWNTRAKNPKDRWSENNDFRIAVGAINKEMQCAADFQEEHPARCLIVRYENIFGPGAPDTAAAILDWLELKHAPQLFAAVQKNRAVASRISDKPMLEYDGQREYIQQHIDWSVIERIEAIAV